MRKYIFEIVTLIAAITCIAASANAQIADKKSLNLQGAKQVIAAAQAEAKHVNAPGGVVAVVDDGGNLIAVERLDGTFNAGANISIGKARTAALFKKPTKFFEDIIKNGRTAMVALNDFTPLQGGVPVIVDNQIIGAVGVSGAASAQQDEELAIAGANVFAAKPVAATAPSDPRAMPAAVANGGVKYFQACDVDASFDKGAVLYDGGGSNYMIHTSRRKEPGLAEVHTKDADLIYVVDGTATFITGGNVLEAKNIAADEIRGSSINGGNTRKLAKGDVIVVPAGTPHQFKEVSSPFLYYVVKVR
jgi:glc operon protein GlcG